MFLKPSSVFSAIVVALLSGSIVLPGEAFLSQPRKHCTPSWRRSEIDRLSPLPHPLEALPSYSFADLRKGFPDDADIVKAGGWQNLERLASKDPKAALVEYIVDGLLTTPLRNVENRSTGDTETTIEALALLLYGMGKGFHADLIDGEWDLVFTKQGAKSPSFQKIVGKKETAGYSKNVFDVSKMLFSGSVRFWKWGQVATTVNYTPTKDAFSVSAPGKIVVRRIVCKIVNAFFKWWKLPGIPFPLPKRKGYLEIVYLDEDIRVTRGNRGGFFVHFRPRFLQQVMQR